MPRMRAVTSPIDLVVFDLVGTTVADMGEAPRAFQSALDEFGIGLDQDALLEVRGSSKRVAIARLLGPDREHLVDDVYLRFVGLVMVAYRDGAVAAEGADLVFEWLGSRGIAVALNTGFDRKITDALLGSLDWPRLRFAAVVSADDVSATRPSPDMIFAAMAAAKIQDPRRVANVGDTRLDLEAGANAGVRLNIGVCSGAHGQTILSQAPHTHLIETVSRLPELLSTKLLVE